MPIGNQIPQSNTQFARINPDFSNLTRAYGSYIDQIIQKDAANRTIFENIIEQTKSIEPGNGSDNDKAAFQEINREFGKRINQVSSLANTENGYADLTNQIHKLYYDIKTDKGYQALQQSYMHSQKVAGDLFGQQEVDATDTKGVTTRRKVDNYPGWNNDIKRVEYKRVMDNSGVKFNDKTQEWEFQGTSVDLPEYIDKEVYFREKFTKEIQQYEFETGLKFNSVDEGFYSIDRQSIKGKNWEGINRAMQESMRTDEKYNTFIRRKAELMYYDPDKKTSNFSLNEEIQKDLQEHISESSNVYGSNGENIDQYLATLKSKNINDYNKFIKNTNISNSDTPYQKLLKINSYNTNIITENYDNLRNNRLKQLSSDLNNNLLSEDDKNLLSQKIDFDLGKEMIISKLKQSDYNTLSKQNEDIYGKQSMIWTHVGLYDKNKRDREKKEDEEKARKFLVTAQSGYMNLVDNIDDINSNVDDWNKQVNKDKIILTNALKAKGFNNPNVNVYDLIKEGFKKDKDFFKNNPDIKELNDKLAISENEYNYRLEKQKDILNSANQLSEEQKQELFKSNPNYRYILQSDKDAYIAFEKNKRTNRKKELTSGAAGNVGAISALLINDSDEAVNADYNNTLKALTNDLQKFGINETKVNGEILLTQIPEQDQQEINGLILDAINSVTSGIFKGDNIKNETLTSDKRVRDIFSGLFKPDGTKDKSGLTATPIATSDNRVKYKIFYDSKVYDLDLTNTDVADYLSTINTRLLRNAVQRTGDNLDDNTKRNYEDIMYTSMSGKISGNEIIKDKNNNNVKVPITFSNINSKFENLKANESVNLELENTPVRVTKVDGDGRNRKGLLVYGIKDDKGYYRDITTNEIIDLKNPKSYFPFDNSYSAQATLVRRLGDINNFKKHNSKFTSIFNFAN